MAEERREKAKGDVYDHPSSKRHEEKPKAKPEGRREEP